MRKGEAAGMTDHLGSTSQTTRSIRLRHRRLVLDLLRENVSLSQADLARKTGLSRTTISTLISELRGMGLIVEAEPGRAGASGLGGRPPTMIALDDSAGAAVGIDLGHGHVRVAVANLAQTVLSERYAELELDRDVPGSLDTAAALVGEALDEAGVERSRVIGAGMGLPGPIDRARGVIASNAILSGWRLVPAAEEMSARLGVPVELDNDANLGALAETVWGAGQGCAHVAYVKASTGIGCGLVIDGWLFRGARGIAGELGHTVVNESGLVCYCGRRGCLETVAGAQAVTELVRRSHGDHLTLDRVAALAVEGDPSCARAIVDIAGEIGIAAANVCNMFNPERLVVGGTLALGGELVLRPIRDAVEWATRHFTTAATEVVLGQLGDRAEVLGALALVMRDASQHLSLRLGVGT
jgi:predicted NBD/HSP70 family sugar kinase/biotin operon repressor